MRAYSRRITEHGGRPVDSALRFGVGFDFGRTGFAAFRGGTITGAGSAGGGGITTTGGETGGGMMTGGGAVGAGCGDGGGTTIFGGLEPALETLAL